MSSYVGAGQCRTCHSHTSRAVERDATGDIIKCTACQNPCEHKSWEGFRKVERDMCRMCGSLKFSNTECTSKIGHVWHKKIVNVWVCKGCTHTIFMPICPRCSKPILPEFAMKGIKACVTNCTEEKKPEPKPTPEPEDDGRKLLWDAEPEEDILTDKEKKTQVQAYKLTGNSGENVELLYAGAFHKGFMERCQKYANAAECMVRMNMDIQVKFFRPEKEDQDATQEATGHQE